MCKCNTVLTVYPAHMLDIMRMELQNSSFSPLHLFSWNSYNNVFVLFFFFNIFFFSFLSGTVQVLLLLVLHEFKECFLVSVYFKTDLTNKS